jgi:hypothetical protein
VQNCDECTITIVFNAGCGEGDGDPDGSGDAKTTAAITVAIESGAMLLEHLPI